MILIKLFIKKYFKILMFSFNKLKGLISDKFNEVKQYVNSNVTNKIIIKKKNIYDSNLPNEIKTYFIYFRLLIKNSIMDYSIIKILCQNLLNLDKNNNINNEEKNIIFKNFRKELKHLFKEIFSDYLKSTNIKGYYDIILLLISFYLILYNMEFCFEFYNKIFETEKNKFFECIFTFIENEKLLSVKKDIIHILNYIFSDIEIINKINKLKINEKLDYYKNKIDNYKLNIPLIKIKDNISKFRDSIIYLKKLDYDYKILFNNQYDEENLKIVKNIYIQCLCRITLSNQIKKIKPNEHNYIPDFLNLLANKSLIYYKNIFNNNYKEIFKSKNIIYDDILKYFCFIYGGEFYLNYIKPIIIFLLENDCEKIEIEKLNEVFNNFVDNIEKMPKIILCSLKFIENELQKNFNINLNNIYPIFTFLLNYYLNPIFEEIYFDNIKNDKKLIEINNLFTKIFYGEIFDKNNKYFYLNEFIEKFNEKLKNIILELNNKIISNDVDFIIKNDLDKFIKLPTEFLFIYDNNFLQKFMKKNK